LVNFPARGNTTIPTVKFIPDILTDTIMST
jgi:hypothetical protein